MPPASPLPANNLQSSALPIPIHQSSPYLRHRDLFQSPPVSTQPTRSYVLQPTDYSPQQPQSMPVSAISRDHPHRVISISAFRPQDGRYCLPAAEPIPPFSGILLFLRSVVVYSTPRPGKILPTECSVAVTSTYSMGGGIQLRLELPSTTIISALYDFLFLPVPNLQLLTFSTR